MTQEAVFKILETIADDLSGEEVTFPTFLDITFRVRALLRTPNYSVEQLSQLVAAEPLMSTQLVRIANSVALNPSGQRISDVRAAIVRVGAQTVRTVSFAVAMRQLAHGQEMLAFKDLSRKLWEHSAYAAALCRALARRLCKGKIKEDEAMFVGLVHDIGAFYLLFRAARFPELTQDEESLKALLIEWHDSIGVSLLSALGQSEEILAAVQEHEQAREISTIQNISDLLYVANLIANLIAPWYEVQPTESDLLTKLFDADTLQEFLGESETEVGSIKQALGA
jgi:HD-like signal output (HDOD) protein